jgi:hypothetical protein
MWRFSPSHQLLCPTAHPVVKYNGPRNKQKNIVWRETTMGILKHDGTVVNLDTLDPVFDTNANGFGPETTRNPDMAGPAPAAQHGMLWSRGYFQGVGLRANNEHMGGRSGKLPAGNATLPGVTTR